MADAYKIARYQSSTTHARYVLKRRIGTIPYTVLLQLSNERPSSAVGDQVSAQTDPPGILQRLTDKVRYTHWCVWATLTQLSSASVWTAVAFFALVCFLVQQKRRSRPLVPHSLAMLKATMKTTFNRWPTATRSGRPVWKALCWKRSSTLWATIYQ